MSTDVESKPPFNVILLKSSDQPAEASKPSDRYVDALLRSDSGLRIGLARQINLLEFKFMNADRLRLRLADVLVNQFFGDRLTCKSMVITSKQTVEAFESAMLEGPDLNEEFKSHLVDAAGQQALADKPTVYCVGQATCDRFQSLVQRLTASGLGLSDRLVVKVTGEGGESKAKHKQNSQELAKLIIADFESHSAAVDDHLVFYPCSAIRKDDLSEHLKRAGLRYDELFVYNTSPSAAGVQELRQLVGAAESPTRLVFFSPSGVEAALEVLVDIGRPLEFISVGPSTTAKLKLHVPSDRIKEMSEPSPQALVELLKTL